MIEMNMNIVHLEMNLQLYYIVFEYYNNGKFYVKYYIYKVETLCINEFIFLTFSKHDFTLAAEAHSLTTETGYINLFPFFRVRW